jgi:hypothetical protein
VSLRTSSSSLLYRSIVIVSAFEASGVLELCLSLSQSPCVVRRNPFIRIPPPTPCFSAATSLEFLCLFVGLQGSGFLRICWCIADVSSSLTGRCSFKFLFAFFSACIQLRVLDRITCCMHVPSRLYNFSLFL